MLVPQRYISKAVNHAGPKVLLAPPAKQAYRPLVGVSPRLKNCGAGTATVALASRNRNEHSKALPNFVRLLVTHVCPEGTNDKPELAASSHTRAEHGSAERRSWKRLYQCDPKKCHAAGPVRNRYVWKGSGSGGGRPLGDG